GVVGILSAFYAASTGQDLLEFLVSFTTMFLGPLLGIFLMGVLLPKVNATGAFYGTIAAVIVVMIASNAGWLTFPGIWRSAITTPIAVLLGWGLSYLGPSPTPRHLQGLTIWTPQSLAPSSYAVGRPGAEDEDFNRD
ncbi:MAG: sodium-coupled permease, partial [Synechocystis sp.]|nr:sodium-coupled permease [Synechocystis sp.]